MFKLFGIKDKSTTPSINLQSDKKEYFLSRDNLVDTIRQKDLELAHIQQEIRIRKNEGEELNKKLFKASGDIGRLNAKLKISEEETQESKENEEILTSITENLIKENYKLSEENKKLNRKNRKLQRKIAKIKKTQEEIKVTLNENTNKPLFSGFSFKEVEKPDKPFFSATSAKFANMNQIYNMSTVASIISDVAYLTVTISEKELNEMLEKFKKNVKKQK